MFEKTNTKGELIQFVKIYNDSDSDQWSFDERDDQIIEHERLIEAGDFNLQTGQVMEKFNTLHCQTAALPLMDTSAESFNFCLNHRLDRPNTQIRSEILVFCLDI